MTVPYSKIEDEIKNFGVCATNTSGSSMRPLFKTHRDVVVLKRPDRDFKKYDVVLYKNHLMRYVLHRVIAIRGDILVIRGDNTYKKEYVPRDAVIALMAGFNRKGRHYGISEFGYKFYCRFWNIIYPVRFIAHTAVCLLRRIARSSAKENSEKE